MLLASDSTFGLWDSNGAPAWNEDPTAASLGRLCSQFVNSAATKDERATRAIGGPLIQMDMVLERLGAHRLGFRENWTEEHRIAVAVEQLCNECVSFSLTSSAPANSL